MSPFYEKLTFELEFITPAFIGGAFPDEEAELRPASFIGILRWWFRNLALTVTDDIEAIAYLESELFGNQKRAGKVWVKIEPLELKNINHYLEEKEKIKKKLLKFSPFAYLGYGNILFISFCKKGNPNFKNIKKYFYILKNENCLDDKEIKQPFDIENCGKIKKECYSGNFLVKDFLISPRKPKRKAIKHGCFLVKNLVKDFLISPRKPKRKKIKQPFYSGCFLVKYFLRFRQKLKLEHELSYNYPTYKITVLVPKNYLTLIENLFKIISQLGSIGGRNRRGWGSFYLRSGNKDHFSPYWNQQQLNKAYDNFTQDFRKILKKYNQELSFKPFQSIKIFLRKYHKETPIDVLETLGVELKKFRNRLGLFKTQLAKDYFEAKNFLEKNFKNENEIDKFLKEKECVEYNRAWFGFPIGVRYSSVGNKSAIINLFERKNFSKRYRLASPVIFRVVRLKNGRYGAVFIVLEREKFIGKLKNCNNLETWKFRKGNTEILPYILRKEKVKTQQGKLKEKTIAKPVVMTQTFHDFIIETFLKRHLKAQELFTWGKKNENKQ